jgi:beta-galactosidase/beta-glucuronidase
MQRSLFIFILFLSSIAHAADTLDLAGAWRFRMDPRDEGERQRWFEKTLPEIVRLPGSMMENHKGDRVTAQTRWTASIYDSSWFFDPRMAKYRRPDNLKIPFWLTPPTYYVGAAWYQKTIQIPAAWTKRHIVLYLERPHSETTVWLDDKMIGQQYGFCTAQEFDLKVTPGRHTLTLRIDNRIKAINVGPDSPPGSTISRSFPISRTTSHMSASIFARSKPPAPAG